MRKVWGIIALVLCLFAALVFGLAAVMGLVGAFIGATLGSLSLLAVLHLARFGLDARKILTEPDIRKLALKARLRGLWVEETSSSIAIRVNSWTSVELHWRNGGIRYGTEFSTSGLVSLLILSLLGFTSIVALLVIVWCILAVDDYTQRTIVPLLEWDIPDKEGEMDEIKELLIISLSEARGIADEVYRATISTYQDFLVMVFGFIGILGGLLIFVLMSMLHILIDSYFHLALPLAIAFVLSFVSSLIVYLLLRRRFRSRVVKAKDWVIKLNQALATERSGEPVIDGQSALEMLLQVNSEMPTWLIARNKGGYRNQAWWFLVFFLGTTAASAIVSGTTMLAQGILSEVSIAYTAFGLVLVLVLQLIYLRLKKQEGAEAFQAKESWERRTRLIQEKYERLLEEM